MKKKKDNKESKDNRAIKGVMAALEKRFEEPVLIKMSESKTNIETFSSGRKDLDAKLGGGYPVGKVIEIYSEEAKGKTGLALEAIREIQKDGGVAAIIDAEHSLNIAYAKQIGVNVDDLYIVQPSYGEQGFEALRMMIDSAQFDLIVVDSVSALTPKAVLEGEVGEAKMAALARMMSKGLSMIVAPASTVGCTVIFLNQLRETLSMYGVSKKPSGGNSLKFYAFQRLEIKSKGQIKEGDEVVGFKQWIRIVKNKAAAPFQEIENDIIYGKGVDSFSGTVDALLEKNIITKRGAYFYYGETTLAQGVKKLRVVFEDNPELVEELKSKL